MRIHHIPLWHYPFTQSCKKSGNTAWSTWIFNDCKSIVYCMKYLYWPDDDDHNYGTVITRKIELIYHMNKNLIISRDLKNYYYRGIHDKYYRSETYRTVLKTGLMQSI